MRAAALGAIAVAWVATNGSPPGLADEGKPYQQDSALDAVVGRALFERQWVGAPASTNSADGLGPLFNARSCSACHRQGGAARLGTRNGEPVMRGLVVRVAAPGSSSHPELGRQIQDQSLPGIEAEGRIGIAIANGAMSAVTRLGRTARTAAVFATRVAPSLKGKALLEKVDERAVLALADPEDRDGDGISGRPHFIRQDGGGVRLGRYGSKAMGAGLAQQVAEAAALDIGLSSPLVGHPHGDCTPLQPDCLALRTGRSPLSDGEELSAEGLRLLVAYVRSLDAPRAPAASDGFKQFASMGCGACHVPRLPAADGRSLAVFSDLLLHDMGPGHGSPIEEGDALSTEWRTAPLLDLNPSGGSRRYLHDGSAASLEEAVARHGGEAGRARDAFMNSPESAQMALLEFLSKL